MANRNSKVLHARVSKELYEKISAKARKHRITISNLVRNMVEDYLDIQTDVLDAIDNRIRNYLDKSEDIIGYQPITLEKNTKCHLCQKRLKTKTKAYIGFLENSPYRIVICAECKQGQK